MEAAEDIRGAITKACPDGANSTIGCRGLGTRVTSSLQPVVANSVPVAGEITIFAENSMRKVILIGSIRAKPATHGSRASTSTRTKLGLVSRDRIAMVTVAAVTNVMNS